VQEVAVQSRLSKGPTLPQDTEEDFKQYTRIIYHGADKSLARPTSRCILFDGYNISFDASLVIYK